MWSWRKATAASRVSPRGRGVTVVKTVRLDILGVLFASGEGESG